jgi:hypothetical protein
LPPDEGLEVARWSARAALARAELLAELHRWDEVIATCARVAQRYGDRFEQELREYCAAALCAEGEARAQLGDADAAISLWTQLVTTYRRETTTKAHELVARGRTLPRACTGTSSTPTPITRLRTSPHW